MEDDVTVEFDEIERETESAFLISIGDDEYWLPKSQVRMYKKSSKVYVPEWLAIEKGLA